MVRFVLLWSGFSFLFFFFHLFLFIYYYSTLIWILNQTLALIYNAFFFVLIVVLRYSSVCVLCLCVYGSHCSSAFLFFFFFRCMLIQFMSVHRIFVW